MKQLSNNIKIMRQAKGITQKDLGDYLGVAAQTISKWENATTMPDITLLPDISKFFQVSVDQLLGILPIDSVKYQPRNKLSNKYRDKNMSQFLASRELYWNEDFLEFLIEKVWCIRKPVKIAEFNCGNGIFAQMILKHLPAGSEYIGFETSPNMIKNAVANVLSFDEVVNYKDYFDLAICQGYLRHHNNPITGIYELKSIVKTGGLVICHEENRPFEIAGLLLGDLDDDSFEKGIFLEKLWKSESLKEGRDYRIGLRLPLLLDRCGLKHVSARLNDRINVINHTNKDLLEFLNEHYRTTSVKEEDLLKFLIERGLSKYEAFRYLELYNNRKQYMAKDIEDIELVHLIGLVISWGYK